MKEITIYECEYCKKLFRTKHRHDCKFDPKKKNCFTCKHLKGWLESEETIDVGTGYIHEPNYPNCMIGNSEDWNIETIKHTSYNMQCEKWEQGQYNHDTKDELNVF